MIPALKAARSLALASIGGTHIGPNCWESMEFRTAQQDVYDFMGQAGR